MWRDPEWLQRSLDALRATLDVEPSLKQEMIQFLFDEGFWNAGSLSPAAATVRFNACLNPGKPEFFKLSELWALMKRFQRYELLLAMCEDMGFERPRLIPTAMRRQVLMERLAIGQERLANELASIRAELERLDDVDDTQPELTIREDARVRIHPAMRERGAKFSMDGEGGF